MAIATRMTKRTAKSLWLGMPQATRELPQQRSSSAFVRCLLVRSLSFHTTQRPQQKMEQLGVHGCVLCHLASAALLR